MTHVARLIALGLALFALDLLGCSRPKSEGVATSSASFEVASIASRAVLPSTSEPMLAHDPAHPPIDCPLRKQGIDLLHAKPFEDTQKYIAFLERTDRATWQKPDEVVAALGLRGTEIVFDLGAGSGYFSFRFAKALVQGKVIAGDTEAEMIRHIHHRAMREGLRGVEVKLIQPDDPAVPPEVDWVFMCDVLHHVADRPVWLGKLVSEMKPGSRLALIEFKEGRLPEGPPESAKIPRVELMRLVTAAGLVPDGEKPSLLPYQTFLLFRKP